FSPNLNLRNRVKLPNVQSATVPERKITHYLLNPAHIAGGSKARFFLRFGFTASEWRLLAKALIRHARENEVAAIRRNPSRYPLRCGRPFGGS
ncbi:MAG TPA: hypothetical protein VGN61_10605, partial [Verrucomicrobiae bacterium]